MKREEKNQQMKRKIMDSALREFAQQGYGASSVNSICSMEGVSKGIIYHYFQTKDELYLACVKECFDRLTDHLSTILEERGTVEEQLEAYFSARFLFFEHNPVYRPIFCEVIISPPANLVEQIQECRTAFDALTVRTLEKLLSKLPLRSDIQVHEVVELFGQFQDFVNAQYRGERICAQERFSKRDDSCRKMLHVLLYGVIERMGDSQCH